jgi:membrane dipeptidase
MRLSLKARSRAAVRMPTPSSRGLAELLPAVAGLLLLLMPALLAVGCGGPASEEDASRVHVAPASQDLQAEADRLAHELLIIDTHVDVPYRLQEEMEDISQATEKGDFDFPRARAGGLDAPFMSIYVPARFQEEGGAKEYADGLIDMVEGIARDHADKFAIATTPEEVLAVVAEGKIALPMGMENGAPVEDDLANLQHFFDRGIRYITLTHAENNQICDSSYADDETWHGLSPFGREVVAEMNRLGIMVDVSHVSDDTFEQVIELSKAPVVASHSSCRKFTPGWQRNMSDDMIRELAGHGGVIQINFGSAFLTEEANKYSNAFHAARGAYLDENGLEPEDPETDEWEEHYHQEHPYPYAALADVADHIDHVVDLVGIDHVGLGSDFDGVGDSLPEGLKDVSGYPNLIRELLSRGYSEGDLAKICGGNLMRVWGDVERVASELQAGGDDGSNELEPTAVGG